MLAGRVKKKKKKKTKKHGELIFIRTIALLFFGNVDQYKICTKGTRHCNKETYNFEKMSGAADVGRVRLYCFIRVVIDTKIIKEQNVYFRTERLM